MNEVTVNPADLSTPYVDLLPPLALERFYDLQADIEANGQRVPIVVTPDGVVIDGHHRLKACLGLGLVPRFEVVETDQPEALAIKLNMARRNLSPDELSTVRLRQRALAWKMAESGMTQAEVGAALGVARRTIAHWLANIPNGEVAKRNKPDNRVKVPVGARPEIVERIEAGETQAQVAADFGVNQPAIAKIVRAEKARQEETEARQSTFDATVADADGDGWKMLHGDFRERLLEVEPGTVDLVVTDPPYPAEFLPLWSDLSAIAARILKPQGVLVALTGAIFLPEVVNRLGEHLAWGWLYIQPMGTGSQSRIMGRHVLQAHKPWLAFSNGQWPSGSVDWHSDLLDPSVRNKDRYRWEQDPGPAAMLIDSLCPEGGTVVDPFTGTGTYGLVARQMGRRFIGTEMDAERFELAAGRLRG
jgi:site-specific DNA-methyltransferase (adenine-specific)